MKFQLFALLLVVAGACAMPSASDVAVVDSSDQPASRIIVEIQFRYVIRQISNAIRNAGLDPLVIEYQEFAFDPLFGEIKAFIENLRFVGASDIRIHFLNYSNFFNSLQFDISLPEVSLSVGDSGIEGSINDHKIGGQFKGSVVIESIRLSGEIRVNISIINGVSLRSVSLNFRVGDIRSKLSLSVQEIDFSESLNILLNESIPKALQEHRADINKRLENIVKEVFARLVE